MNRENAFFLLIGFCLALQLNGAQENQTPRAAGETANFNRKDIYQTDATALPLSKNAFLFGLNTVKIADDPRRIASFHLVIQKSDEYEVYSEIRTGRYKAIDPAVGDLIREHEGNLMKHFIVFLDAIDPALVPKFLTTRQRVTSIIEDQKDQKAS